MKNFADRLVRKIAELDNPTVMGLDPKLDYIPSHLIEEARAEYPKGDFKVCGFERV